MLLKSHDGAVFEEMMTADIKVDKDNKIIERTVNGYLYTERSLRLVHELAFYVSNHKGYDVLLDMRDTVTYPEMIDLMEIATTCSELRSDFNNKIAILIPNTLERIRFAQLFKSCMDAQGFRLKHFLNYEAAIDWLGEVT